MSNCTDCPVYFRGLSTPGADAGPTVLARTDQEFIQAVLDEVSAADGLTALGKSAAKMLPGESALKLFQPVHRTFNLVVLEIGCDVTGQPRLDPARIDSAGLVVRRVHEPVLQAGQRARQTKSITAALTAGKTPKALATQNVEELRGRLESAFGIARPTSADCTNPETERTDQMEAWMQMGKQLQGWVQLGPGELCLDPDPERRRPAARAGNPLIDELLSASGQQPRAEAVSPLFVAPPDVCRAAHKTVLYGMLPVTSTEISETPEALPPFPQDAVKAHLSDFLKAGTSPATPQAGGRVTAANAVEPAETMAAFILLLRQLAIELDAFGTSATAKALLAQVNQISLSFTFGLTEIQTLPDNPFRDLVLAHLASATTTQWTKKITLPAGDFLRLAVPVLVERLTEDPADGRSLSLDMPDAWPAVTAARAAAIQTAVIAAMQARLAGLASKSGRFDEVGRLYHAVAFVRVKGKPGCPPTLIWSKPSAPFTIAAWYESGNATPIQIRLPDVSDREFLKKIKPNVAFVMPEGLFNLLNRNDPKDLKDGKAGAAGDSIGLQWICSFSIPIITICAFIVLYIFLTLFDLIFHWLMFIKICIPFPKKG
jgi:hypothetical protein